MTTIESLSVLVVAAALFVSAASADKLSSDAATTLEMTTFASGLVLPTAIEFLPDGRLVIGEKTGRVLVRKPSGQTVVAGQLDVDAKTEKGLLNVIRHPNFGTTRELIFYYSSAAAPVDDKQRTTASSCSSAATRPLRSSPRGRPPRASQSAIC